MACFNKEVTSGWYTRKSAGNLTFFLPYKLSPFLASAEESKLENFLDKVILNSIDKKDTMHYGRKHLP